MKIREKKGSSGVSKVGSSRKGSKSGSQKIESSDEKSDSVEISTHSQTVEMIKGLIASSPDIRSNQVDRIVDLLNRGEYKLNYQGIAESFIRDVILRELSQGKNKK